MATVDIAPYLAQTKVDDAAEKAFYDANQPLFQNPEQVKIEYVILSRDSLTAEQTVSDEEVKKAYDATYAAGYAEKEKAHKKAEGVLAEARQHPENFAELAKKYSQDPGSAKNGGDLGYFGRGSMVKSFEEAAFKMKPNQISDLVESEFGYHIIRLTGIKPATKDKAEERQASHILITAPKDARDFATAKPQIEQQLKQQKAGAKFAEAADNFQNLVYEQADNLQGVAKTLNLKLEHTEWITRPVVQQLGRNNPKFAQAVFAPEATQSKRNTEAVEIAPNTLISARVVDHKAAAPRPYAEVKTQIERQLKQREAAEMAAKAGKEKLALLEQGKSVELAWGKPQTISRQEHGPEFNPEAIKLIFVANAAKLPAYVGVANPSAGYSLFRISKVITPAANDDAKIKSAATRIGEQVARESLTAYVAELKKKADVTIKQENLEKKQ
jgi:peptidyl-prolyl cis-trans isomerase D